MPKFKTKAARRNDLYWNPIALALEKVYSCVVTKSVTPEVIARLQPMRSLMGRSVVESRMSKAKVCNKEKQARYNLIPAGAGAKWGELLIRPLSPQVMMRGLSPFSKNRGDGKESKPIASIKADFPTWLKQSFTVNDYVVMKIDIEGGEFEIIPALIEQNVLPLIDVLAWECHDTIGDCANIHKLGVSASPTTKWLSEGEDYEDNLYI